MRSSKTRVSHCIKSSRSCSLAHGPEWACGPLWRMPISRGSATEVERTEPTRHRSVEPLAARVRHLRFKHQGFQVTVLSVELASVGASKRFQAGFTVEAHSDAPASHRTDDRLVFDTHSNALRYGRTEAKRQIATIAAIRHGAT